MALLKGTIHLYRATEERPIERCKSRINFSILLKKSYRRIFLVINTKPKFRVISAQQQLNLE